MINIDSALKTIYKNDRFPEAGTDYPKDMEAHFEDIDVTILGDQFADDKGEFELSEGICKDGDLKFGKCNSAQVKFTVADVVDEIAGQEFELKQSVNKGKVIAVTRISGASTQVQTVQGKNLFDKNRAISGKNVNVTNGLLTDDALFSASDYIPVLPNTTYYKTLLRPIAFYNSSKMFISGFTNVYSSPFTTPDNTAFIRTHAYASDINVAQLELGSTATAYEPFVPNSPSPDYPSPIISAHDFDIVSSNGVDSNSVHIPGEYGSLPNGVRDTRELIGGVPTDAMRTKTVVFDGSADEVWSKFPLPVNGRFRFSIGIGDKKPNNEANGIWCSNLKSIAYVSSYNSPNPPTDPSISGHNTASTVSVWGSIFDTMTIEEFRLWLSTHPITAQYELATPIYTPVEPIELQSYGPGTQVTTTAVPQVEIEYSEQYSSINYEMPFGYYTVDTCPKQDDLRFKDITAYDRMRRVSVDVAAWYNGLTFPMTLAAFRASFLAYVGLTQDTSRLPLPNDSMTVEKTIEAAVLPGQEVIEKIEEINGVFGVINPAGQFSHVILNPGYGDYPTNDYPQDDYPVNENDTSVVQPDLIDETITVEMREGIRFEEYAVPEIDKLIIRGEEDDIGAIVGTGTNAYIIEGNWIVYGKSAGEMQAIATNAFGYMARRPYRPYESNQIGLPYIKPGDMLLQDQDEPVTGYMLNRTLRGVQSMRDEMAAPGSQKRTQNTSQNTEIVKLKYRTTKLKVDLDGVIIEVSDLAEATSSAITVLYDNINLKVDKSGIVQSINLSTEGLKIDVTKLDINGIVTANNNFKILLDGSMEAVNGKFSGAITASSISGTTFTQTGTNGTVQIVNGGIIADLIFTQSLNVGSSISLASGAIQCSSLSVPSINNGTPITSQNIGSQSVSHASTATSATSAANATHASDADTADYAADAGEADFARDAFGILSSNYLYAAHVSTSANFIPDGPGQYIGSSVNYWAGAYLGSGPPVTSDRNLKHDINVLSDKYLIFAKKLCQIARIFKYNDGTSDRLHVGFIAQEVEEAMTECGISDMEFAGLVKAPEYSKKLEDGEYDTTSEIIGYRYFLRYEEFVPLMFALFTHISLKNN